jgi:excisionase family DNA binding protein
MLTTEQAAKLLGVKSAGHVRQLIFRKQLRSEKFGPNNVIDPREIDRYLRERERKAKKKTAA